MESSRARNPPAVISDSTQMVTPAPSPHQSDNILDGQKIGGTLLFCGVTLALVGITYITTGWQYYQASVRFEWTELLGPILISAGGAFALTSFCKFSIISCSSCQQWDEEALAVAVMEQTSRGCCFTISGSSQHRSRTQRKQVGNSTYILASSII
ncbi:Transmembrane protein 174 [Channa argus]|uniref:Transmembrane protein 174 n=1 Tax=Channa argus TaxID=215402 RepID=A0A6G1QGZ5_CHAAH|nr:Transmembrane protein 174 [Channa argus]